MDPYFAKFPNTVYQDLNCKDISKRVGLSNEIRKLPTLFYPYEIQAGQRADIVSWAYYKDPELDWLIYITNGILDPYYDWYLNEQDFQDFLIKKYGSVEESQERIRYYALAWADDDSRISVDFYNSTLDEELKKYWTPVFGEKARISYYLRRREDWTVNTNKIITFTVNSHSNAVFSNNERIAIKSGGQNVGNGEVIVANSTVVTIQHVGGNTSASNLINGLTSGANATILDTDLVQDNIPDAEFAYWEPVTIFEWERSKNESKKQIYLLEANWALEASEQLRQRLKE